MLLINAFYKNSQRKIISLLIHFSRTLLSSNVYPTLRLLGLRLASFSHDYIPRKLSKELENAFLESIRQLQPHEIYISGTGSVVMITTEDTYYLSASQLSNRSLQKSYIVWRSIQKSKLRTLVPSRWEQVTSGESLLWRVEKLSENEQVQGAQLQKVLSLLWCFGRNLAAPYRNINRWKQMLKFMLEGRESRYWTECVDVLANSNWRIGPCHRDLTPRNLMFRNDDPILIDLDRFTWKGIQIFDLIHFEVELYTKKKDTDWFSISNIFFFDQLIKKWATDIHLKQMMIKLHPNYSAKDLLHLYMLERLSLELRPNTLTPDLWRKKAEALLLEKEEEPTLSF